MSIQPLAGTLSSSALAAQIAPTSRPPSAPEAATAASAVGASIPAPATPRLASQEPNQTELLEAVAKVQKAVPPTASNLVFSIDDDSGRTVVKVVDSSTEETIRQIPSEEVLEIARALDKLQGLLLRQTA